MKIIKFLPFYFLSVFPLRLLYLLSDLIFVLSFYILKYRRKMCLKHISDCFPEKSPREIKGIEKAYYRHLSDLIVESLKGMTAGNQFIHRHMRMKNDELIRGYYEHGESLVLYAAHIGNWEWLNFLSPQLPHRSVTLYQQLSSNYFNELVLQVRERLDVKCVEIRRGYYQLKDMLQQDELLDIGIIGDQSPPRGAKSYMRVEMFGRSTAFSPAPIKIAQKFALPMAYPYVRKLKRGYYEIEFMELTADSSQEKTEGILRKYADLLEANVREQPELWLWTHNRWKLNKQDGLE